MSTSQKINKGIFTPASVFIKNTIRILQKKKMDNSLPLNGYEPNSKNTQYLDLLSNADLIDLNNILNWNCFVTDGHGRRFGNLAWGGKRNNAQQIPDRRIVGMHERFDLYGKHVLEVGCFEGVHTLGLLNYAEKVTAVDSRVDHVVKTLVRCGMFGKSPNVFKCDIESENLDTKLLEADFIHHVGILYHLKDPVKNLLDMGTYIKHGVMLDTHYCMPDEVTGTYAVSGKDYAYKKYVEHGEKEAFSGMYDHSKWLLLSDIVECLQATGFVKVDIVETRQERNGPRVLLYAERI